jgi:hypothetical protein
MPEGWLLQERLSNKVVSNVRRSEDVWLEAARLHVSIPVSFFFFASIYDGSLNNEDAKIVLANAVQHVGQSVKIWLAAADLEHKVKLYLTRFMNIGSMCSFSSRKYSQLGLIMKGNCRPWIFRYRHSDPPFSRCRTLV